MAGTKSIELGPVWSRRLKEARLAAGLSQKQLGIAAGLDEFVASTRINRYETGTHQPDYQITTQLAKVLDIPVAYLYCDDDAMAKALLGLHHAPASVRRAVLSLLQTGKA